jgi:hypothetical protein
LVSSLFPCRMVDFPIKYLGIPLSVTKLPKAALVDRITDRLLMWKGWLMHHSGCLALIKSTLTSIPIYTLISIGMPTWMHNALQKIMRVSIDHCKVLKQGKCLVA